MDGFNGNVGAPGANGTVGATGPAGADVTGYWIPGGQGGVGGDGAGGGGGSGAGGGAGDGGGFCFNSSGTGGGGGGGGGGGQGGVGGSGGFGGGSTFGVFIFNNGISGNIVDCQIVNGTAGAGGTGGAGTIGANGGAGGARGCADACNGQGEGNGGTGGAGGKGGNGGAGGPGAAGIAIPVRLVGGSALVTNSSTFTLTTQPVLTADNKACTDVSIAHTSTVAVPAWSSFGVSATPASAAGSPASTTYSTTGRKTLVLNTSSYTDFNNIIVSPPSTGNVIASAVTICPGAANFISSVAGTAGLTYSWSALPAGGTISSATTSSTSITFVNAGVSPITYTVSLSINSQCCGTLTPVTQTIVVYPIPAAPTASVNAACVGGVATFTANTPAGSSFNWYNAASSGTLLATGNTYSIAGVSTPTTVYLQATNAGGCASTLTPVAVTPTNIPSPTALSATSCDPGMVQVGITPASGISDYSWYSDAGGTTLVQTGTTLNYSQNIPVSGGSYTVYVQSNVAGCAPSALIPVTGSVTGTPIVANGTVTANDTVCVNTPITISLNPTGGNGSFSYAWSPVTSTLSTITQTVSASIGYNVIVTSGNCSKQFNFPIIVNPYPKDTIGTPAMISCTSPTISLDGTFSASGPTISYSWTTSGGSIVSAANINTVDVNAPGIYTLTVTDNATGCASNQTVTVSGNSTIPTLTVSPANYTITCATSTVTLNANSSTTGLTYSWTTTGGVLSNTNTANPVASAGGTYSVVITNTVNGCQASGSAIVVPDAAIPTATVSSNTISLDCINLAETVTVTTTPSADITFTWSPSPTSGVNSATPTFASPGTYSCVITNTVNTCNTSVQVVVSTNTTVPTITITPTQTLTCASTTAAISTTVNPTSGISYTWAGTGVTGQTGSSVNVNQAGTYDVLVLDAANGCTNTASSSIVSNVVTPTITVTPITTTLTCLTTTINLNATATTTNAPVWATPSGTASNPVIANAPGDYVASVTDASSGCTRTETITITSNTIAPTANAGAITPIPCGALTTTLNGTASPTTGATYSWSGPTGTSIISGANTANPTVGETGVYTLTVTGTNGCSSTATVAVIQGSVNAQFTANPTTGVSPLVVNFTDQSTGAITYNWNFGNGNVSSSQNPNNTYNGNGTFTVTLIASSGICTDTAYAIIIVEDGLALEIPNVFTPNNDGANDLFTIKSTGVKEISLQIFNRWGEKLYEFNGEKAAWDGLTPSGAKVPSGTYFYFVKATGFDDKEIEQHGTVNLFR
jgi:gliding motility-associated-like protein